MRKLRYFLTFIFVLATFCSCEDINENLYEALGGDNITPEYNTTDYFIPNSPWPTIDLFETPEYYLEETTQTGVLAIVYKAMPYRGNKNHVFCYYSSPSLLEYGDTSHDKDIPAVVCIHGGGGSASASWVKLLAEKGYAAIAMDWRGHSTSESTQQENGFVESSGSTPYYTAWDDQTEDWYYQCIGSMIAANSLIRSMPGVDKDRVGCTGYSWGGIIISTLIGIDQRFAAAIPVYGCGYLYDTPGGYWSVMGRTPELSQYRWKYQYDGMNYLAYTTTPTLYVNGTNDSHFYTGQWEKTASLIPGVSRSMRNALAHGGGTSQSLAEVYSFFSKHLKHGDDLSVPEYNDLRFENDTLYCTLSDVEDDFKAYLLFTEFKESKLEGLGFSTSSDCNALWYKDLIEVKDGKIAHKIPNDYERWMINIEYPNPDPELRVEYEVEEQRPIYSDTRTTNGGSDVYMNFSSKIFFRDNL